MIDVLICGTCGQGFLSERDIREHQDHFARLHAVDPEIDEHDGTPWGRDKVEVGREYTWRPSGEMLTVTRIEESDGETIVWARLHRRRIGDRDEYPNEASTFVDSCWRALDFGVEDKVRTHIAERMVGADPSASLDMKIHGVELLTQIAVDLRWLRRHAETKAGE